MIQIKIQLKAFQLEMARAASAANTLEALPTGLGKTMIALLAAKGRLEKSKAGKAVMLVLAKPLAVQHSKAFVHP